ncbi:MAG: hypothetical protein KJ063_20530 [Anaerolineae bacterium]|nr:hypothetical protein [Anaerolineae bacterium]
MNDSPNEPTKSLVAATPHALVSPGNDRKGLAEYAFNYVMKAINDADEKAAAQRVAELRQKNPQATANELADLLIKNKCRQAGAVGGITSGTSLIPGLGTVASLTFGVAADIGLTFKMQAELVIEIAAAFNHPLAPEEKRNVVLLVTGMSAGANQLLSKAGRQIAEKASERLATKAAAKAIPMLGVVAGAGINMASTYVIGQRAVAYFSRGEEAIGDWADDARAIIGIDERKLMTWLQESTESAWELVKERTQDAGGLMITAGKSAGELVVSGAAKTKVVVGQAGQAVSRGAKIGAIGVLKIWLYIPLRVMAGVYNAGARVVRWVKKVGRGRKTAKT